LKLKDDWVPERCKQCKRLTACQFWCAGFDYHDEADRLVSLKEVWADRLRTCSKNGEFEWDDRLTKYDFEDGQQIH